MVGGQCRLKIIPAVSRRMCLVSLEFMQVYAKETNGTQIDQFGEARSRPRDAPLTERTLLLSSPSQFTSAEYANANAAFQMIGFGLVARIGHLRNYAHAFRWRLLAEPDDMDRTRGYVVLHKVTLHCPCAAAAQL